MDQNSLTDDQTAVYDRQLRVWGVEVQRKLTAAKVLIVGFGKLAAEVAKNITLAGVGHVTLLDDTPAKQHLGDNFLVTTAATDEQTVAEAAAKTLQAMNPLVKVSSHPGSSSSSNNVSSDLIQQQNLVIAVGLGLHLLQQLDDMCRSVGVGFMAAAAAGPGGWYFVDLNTHQHVPKGSSEQEVLSYPSLATALAPPKAPLPNNTHPMYLVLLALLATEVNLERSVTPDDLPAAQQQLHKVASSHPQLATAEQLLSSIVSGAAEFAPVCAVIGGIIANNVVMAVSASGTPLNNLLYYTLFDGRAIVETQPVAAAGVKAAAVQQQQQQGPQIAEEQVVLD